MRRNIIPEKACAARVGRVSYGEGLLNVEVHL
jgi:hypothetical protein